MARKPRTQPGDPLPLNLEIDLNDPSVRQVLASTSRLSDPALRYFFAMMIDRIAQEIVRALPPTETTTAPRSRRTMN